MEATRYRIVYRGEVGLGFEHEKVRENLVRLTRWDGKQIDRLLASSHCIIKSDLDAATAERMLNALNNTGIICRKEPVPATTPVNDSPAAAATIAVVGRESTGVDENADKKCPKCGLPQDGSLSCPACGIIFAKFNQARVATDNGPVAAPRVVSAQAAALAGNHVPPSRSWKNIGSFLPLTALPVFSSAPLPPSFFMPAAGLFSAESSSSGSSVLRWRDASAAASWLAFYLLGGLFAAGAGIGVQQLLPGATLPILGAGGALACCQGCRRWFTPPRRRSRGNAEKKRTQPAATKSLISFWWS